MQGTDNLPRVVVTSYDMLHRLTCEPCKTGNMKACTGQQVPLSMIPSSLTAPQLAASPGSGKLQCPAKSRMNHMLPAPNSQLQAWG
jgi:hypothetical protein